MFLMNNQEYIQDLDKSYHAGVTMMVLKQEATKECDGYFIQVIASNYTNHGSNSIYHHPIQYRLSKTRFYIDHIVIEYPETTQEVYDLIVNDKRDECTHTCTGVDNVIDSVNEIIEDLMRPGLTECIQLGTTTPTIYTGDIMPETKLHLHRKLFSKTIMTDYDDIKKYVIPRNAFNILGSKIQHEILDQKTHGALINAQSIAIMTVRGVLSGYAILNIHITLHTLNKFMVPEFRYWENYNDNNELMLEKRVLNLNDYMVEESKLLVFYVGVDQNNITLLDIFYDNGISIASDIPYAKRITRVIKLKEMLDSIAGTNMSFHLPKFTRIIDEDNITRLIPNDKAMYLINLHQQYTESSIVYNNVIIGGNDNT